MNAIIVEAIRATGAGRETEGIFTVDDVQDLNEYIRTNHLERWTALHGDDENEEEIGFYLVQNDGGNIKYRGDNLINTVAVGVYTLALRSRVITF